MTSDRTDTSEQRVTPTAAPPRHHWQHREPAAIDPVQYKAWCDEKLASMTSEPAGVQAAAGAGVAGPATALPHGDAIQQSFGPHDVSGIQAHVGGPAAEAAGAMGAQAYATGNQVAFAAQPDLHLAAHEAAHVVQQRHGVHLKGGVGAAGDRYEQHADAVADLVVRGESAASLLGDPGHAGGSASVQRKDVPHKPSKADEKKAHDQFESDGPMVVYALAGVFHDSHTQMDYMPAKYVEPMKKLYRVRHGDGPYGHQRDLEGRARRALLDEVFPIFEPFAQANAHFGGEDDNLPGKMTRLRTDVVAAEAYDRVEHAVVVGEGKDKKAMDMPDDSHPREQGEVLRVTLPMLLGSIQRTIASVNAKGASSGVDKNLLQQLVEAEHTLTIGEGFLALSDEEFKLKIDTVKAKMNGVTTYTGLVKTVFTITAKATSLTAQASGYLMKAVGDKAMALICEETARDLSQGFGKVVAAIQIVHGVSVMLDKNASADDKIGAGVEIGGGLAVLVTGETLASLPITGPYMLVKGAQYLYSEAVLGWETDLVRGAFKYMQHDALLIGGSMEHLAAAQLLQQDEKDAERRAALAAQEQSRTQELKSNLTSFLQETEHRDTGTDIYKPGNIQIIADAFAVTRSHAAGAHTQAEIIALSHEVSKQIAWCFKRGPAIVQATATHKNIADVDGIEDKLEKNAKKS